MALPDAWVQRLFDRFAALYGVQKVGAMWAGANLDEVRAVWGDALGSFSGETLAKALGGLAQSPGEWPPTLPQFVALCKSYNRPEQRAHLPAPGGSVTPDAAAREQIAKIRAMLADALRGKVTSA